MISVLLWTPSWWLIALILIPTFAILAVGLIVTMMQVAKMEGRRQSKQAPVTANTSFGEFVKIGPLWTTELWRQERELSIFVRDAKGKPEAESVEKLPPVVESLDALEAQAREAIQELEPHKRLVAICMLDVQGEDFSLNFDSEKPAEHEVVVYFKEMQVIGYSLDD